MREGTNSDAAEADKQEGLSDSGNAHNPGQSQEQNHSQDIL